jgi:nucleoside-diphosphate-sugar epimerase
MRIFVTGGTGFIGSHYIKQACYAGYQVTAIRRQNSAPRINLDGNVKWVEGTLEDNFTSELKKCDAFVHFASHGVDPRTATWDDCYRWNVSATLNQLQSAINTGIKRFVIAGSCFEYGLSGERYEYIPVDAPLEPTGAYHASKACATMTAIGLSIDKKLEMIILRPFHTYGEGEADYRFWPSLQKAALTGDDFEMSEGAQVRDFIEVSEVAKIFLQATIRTDVIQGCPQIENVGSEKPQTLLSFAKSEWTRLGASGLLKPGTVSMRKDEVMRFVPKL